MRSLKAAFTRDGAGDNERGSKLYLAEDYQGAYDAFKKAIEQNPTNAVFYVNRSAANLKLSRLSEAYRDACRSLELNNKLARGYLRKGQVLLKKGEPLLAKKTFHEGMKHATSAADLEMLEQGLADARTAAQFLSMAGVSFTPLPDGDSALPGAQSAPSVMAREQAERRPPAISVGEEEEEEEKQAKKETPEQVRRHPPPPFAPVAGPATPAPAPAAPPNHANAAGGSPARQTAGAAPAVGGAPATDSTDTRAPPVPVVHWSARLLDSLPKPAPVEAGGGSGTKKSGLESLYSPGFLQKHSLNFSSMRDNWLAVVPEWVKGPDAEGTGGLFHHVTSEQAQEQSTGAVMTQTERGEEEGDGGLAVQKGRCIHPIDPETQELVKLDGFFSYEYENNTLFEYLNVLLMRQEQDLVEAIFSLESERKALLNTLPSDENDGCREGPCVQIALMLPQDVTLEGKCDTFNTVMAHMGLLSAAAEGEWVFEAFSGHAKGRLVGTVLTIEEMTAGEVGEGEKETDDGNGRTPGGKSAPLVVVTDEESVTAEKSEKEERKQVQVLRKRTFRMPGLQQPLLILLVSDPLWKEPYRPIIMPPHGGLIADSDLPANPVERFWAKMRHPAASKLSSSLVRFIPRFAKNPNVSAAGKHEKIILFLREFDAELRACPLWAGASQDELMCAREAVNKRVLSDLYDIVFPSVCDPQLDERTSAMVRALWFIVPEQLNVPSEDLDESILYAAKKELMAIDMYKSAREKVECLLNCCRIIIFQINSKGQVSCADDFLPLLILTVLHGGTAPHLHANVAYINLYCERTEELAEAFYYLTMLESAVYFVDNLTAKQVRMPQYLFEKYMRGEMPLYRPMSVDRMLPGDGSSNPMPASARASEPPALLSSAADQQSSAHTVDSVTAPLPTTAVQVSSLPLEEVTHSDTAADVAVTSTQPSLAAPVQDSLLEAIEEEGAGDYAVKLSFITDKRTMSVEGLQLETFQDQAALAQLIAEYRQLAVLVHDLMPSALRF